jgi:hypothetical protein
MDAQWLAEASASWRGCREVKAACLERFDVWFADFIKAADITCELESKAAEYDYSWATVWAALQLLIKGAAGPEGSRRAKAARKIVLEHLAKEGNAVDVRMEEGLWASAEKAVDAAVQHKKRSNRARWEAMVAAYGLLRILGFHSGSGLVEKRIIRVGAIVLVFHSGEEAYNALFGGKLPLLWRFSTYKRNLHLIRFLSIVKDASTTALEGVLDFIVEGPRQDVPVQSCIAHMQVRLALGGRAGSWRLHVGDVFGLMKTWASSGRTHMQGLVCAM